MSLHATSQHPPSGIDQQTATSGFEVEKVLADFPVLRERILGRTLVYLDNAAAGGVGSKIAIHLSTIVAECTWIFCAACLSGALAALERSPPRPRVAKAAQTRHAFQRGNPHCTSCWWLALSRT